MRDIGRRVGVAFVQGLTACAALTSVACGEDPVGTPGPPVRVVINPDSTSAMVGVVQRFDVQLFGGSAAAAPTLVRCAVSDSSRATVTTQPTANACDVTAVAPGRVVLTATSSVGVSDDAVLLVVPR